MSLHSLLRHIKLHQTGQLSNSKLMLSRNQFAKTGAALKLILRMGLFICVTLGALFFRVTGFEPWYIDPASAEFAESNRTAWPGLWLKGEVVDGPVTDWDFINEVNHPITGNSIMLETRTWYGIPHSVTVNARPRGTNSISAE